jgi:hypothetical protein
MAATRMNWLSQFSYAVRRSRSHAAVIRVYDAAGNVIGTPEHVGEFQVAIRTKNGQSLTKHTQSTIRRRGKLAACFGDWQ